MRVGVIGLGDRAAYLMRVFKEHIPEFTFVAYADPNPEPVRLPKLAEWGVDPGKAYLNTQDMLDDEALDLIMVCSPNHFHLADIEASLKAGCKVFTEKPVVTTEEQTFALLDLLQEYGADSVMVGLVLRYAPLFKDVRAAIDAGQLGDIISVEAAEHIEPGHGAFFMRDWRRDAGLSGGFLLEKCCHDIDVYQGLLGSRAKKVASFGSRRFFKTENAALEPKEIYHQRSSRWNGAVSAFGEESQLIDNQVAIIEYEDGANLCFHTNINVPDEFRRFCIVGTKGMAEGDFVRGYLRIHDAQTAAVVLDKSYNFDDVATNMHYGADEEMAADLRAHLLEGAALPVSIIDGLAAGLTAIKIDEARTSGSLLDLSDIWARFDAYKLASN